MKKQILLIVSAVLFTGFIAAQTPQSFNYIAMANNNSGSLCQNQPVTNNCNIHNDTFEKDVINQDRTGAHNSIFAHGDHSINSYTKTSASDYFAFNEKTNNIVIGNSSVMWIGGSVGWSVFSDERFKRNVKENVPGLDFILKLKPVTYQWDIDKLDAYRGIPESLKNNEILMEARENHEAEVYTGFIAQQVEKAAKDTGYNFSGVNEPVNGYTPYSLTYETFTVPLVKAVQELHEKNELLEISLSTQQQIIDELKKQNELLVQRIDKLEID